MTEIQVVENLVTSSFLNQFFKLYKNRDKTTFRVSHIGHEHVSSEEEYWMYFSAIITVPMPCRSLLH
jgi:hypothetical protein